MNVSATLEFENARTLQNLYANNPALLKRMEDVFNVTITTRDGWLKVEGDKVQVDKTRQVFEQLQHAQDEGVSIRGHEVNYAIRGVLDNKTESLQEMFTEKVRVSSKKPFITPRTFGQKEYVDTIRKSDITFGIGPAGTGKTYLAMAMAVSQLKEEKVSRIILTRPAVETGESLGYLPGDLQEKITPYLRPLYDAIHDMMDPEEMTRYMEKGVIEIAPLAYMRGRTLSKAFIILDEAQNTTTEQMFMFLTRLGMNSKCVITGDITQTDLPPNKKSGLVEAISALKVISGIGMSYFDASDVVRHELVAEIIKAYRVYREPLSQPATAKPKKKTEV
ncbi:MAG: PhoH family protein [Verrucomicrobiota bacterium]|nr:PhoH family protein [Verrucomicrobiota bacterium]